jgi:endonuclease/exonuclease/phosphatase (EEP) superfamily protein YafD
VAKQLSVADLSARSAKAANVASAISSGGDIASTAITLISNIQDQKKRAQFQNNFSLLSADQQKALDKQLINANSESERLRILGERLTQLNIQRISNIAGVFAEQEKKKRNK